MAWPTAASRGLSPGSILPPGSMKRVEPAFRTVRSCPSRTRQNAAVTKVVMPPTVCRQRPRRTDGGRHDKPGAHRARGLNDATMQEIAELSLSFRADAER